MKFLDIRLQRDLIGSTIATALAQAWLGIGLGGTQVLPEDVHETRASPMSSRDRREIGKA